MRRALYVMGILNDGDIQWIAKHGAKDRIAAGTVLVQEGNPVHSVYIVLEGKLSVKMAAVGNAEIASLYAGEVVGEISFVDASLPSASVVAGLDSQVLAIPRDVLVEKLASDAPFASRFYRAIATFLASRLRTSTSRFGYGSGKQDTSDPDELDDMSMDNISLAATRFDELLKTLRVN